MLKETCFTKNISVSCKMKRTLVFHSYKGGTGKTTIAANLAAIFAQRGTKVCILDFDFRAPSLHFLFRAKPKSGTWLNDFMNGKCGISDVLYKINVSNGGKLAAGFADPSSDAMWNMTRKDSKWWTNMFRRMLGTKRTILKGLDFDYLVFDTSPGVQDSSMNALAISDIVILVLKPDELEVEGTKELVRKFYKKLGRQTSTILNRALLQPYKQVSDHQERRLSEEIRENFGFPVLGVIPCFCDLFIDGIRVLYSMKKPDHQFVKRLSAIADRIDKL